VVFTRPPFGLQLAVLLEAIERRKERARVDAEVVVAEDGEALRDAVPVQRFARQDGENHEVERSLGNVELLRIVFRARPAHLGLQEVSADDASCPLGCQEEPSERYAEPTVDVPPL